MSRFPDRIPQVEKKKQNPVLKKLVLDPGKTPILYSDNIRITSNKNGLVLDIAQDIPKTDSSQVVARVGLSHEHAKKLASALSIQLLRNRVILPRKNKALN